MISGDTLVDFGQELEINERWLRPGVTREEIADGLRPLLALPVEHVLATHGGPTDRPGRFRARVVRLVEPRRRRARSRGEASYARRVESLDPAVTRLAEEQLAALADVGSRLDAHGFDWWLFGGWAVDFHVGAVTRSHSDIDLAVWADEAEAIESAITTDGWEHEPVADEDGGTGYERRGIRVELTYLVKGEGGGVLIALRDRRMLWSDNSLGNDMLELVGTRARVVRLELLLRGKSTPRDDPAEAEIDRADFDALSRLCA